LLKSSKNILRFFLFGEKQPKKSKIVEKFRLLFKKENKPFGPFGNYFMILSKKLKIPQIRKIQFNLIPKKIEIDTRLIFKLSTLFGENRIFSFRGNQFFPIFSKMS